MTDSEVNKIRFFVFEVGGKILISLENCFGLKVYGESRGAFAPHGRTLATSGPDNDDHKRLTDGLPRRNDYGLKGRCGRSSVESARWMEGFGRRVEGRKNGNVASTPSVRNSGEDDDIRVTDTLPKTRRGKITRRLLRELGIGGDVKDTATLEVSA